MKKLVTKKVTQYEYDKEGRVTKITESFEEYKVDVEKTASSIVTEGTVPFKTAVGVPPTEKKEGKVPKVWVKTNGDMVIDSASIQFPSTPKMRVTGLSTTDILNEVKYALDNVNRTSAF